MDENNNLARRLEELGRQGCFITPENKVIPTPHLAPAFLAGEVSRYLDELDDKKQEIYKHLLAQWKKMYHMAFPYFDFALLVLKWILVGDPLKFWNTQAIVYGDGDKIIPASFFSVEENDIYQSLRKNSIADVETDIACDDCLIGYDRQDLKNIPSYLLSDSYIRGLKEDAYLQIVRSLVRHYLCLDEKHRLCYNRFMSTYHHVDLDSLLQFLYHETGSAVIERNQVVKKIIPPQMQMKRGGYHENRGI